MLKIFSKATKNNYHLSVIIKGVSYERKQQQKRLETLQALNNKLKKVSKWKTIYKA